LQGLGKAPVSVCWRRGLDGSTGGNRLLEGDVRDRILDNLTPQLGQVAIHRSIVPRFDERYAGGPDVEWWLRVATEWPVSSVPRVGLLYRQHTGPRNRNGLRARIDGSLRLLEEHADYFATHPRAAAFRWKRIGLTARRTRDLRFARTAFLRSLRLRPQISTAWHLVRVLRSSGSAVGNIEESRAA
jgi:hypothetical protein